MSHHILCCKIPMVEALLRDCTQKEESCSTGDRLGTLVIYTQVMHGFSGLKGGS